MDPNERQRQDLAGRIRSQRLSRYRGNRKAAYTAVGVNSATWSRAEEGLPIAERTLVAIVEGLWPETGGDWQLMDPPLGGEVDIEDEVRRADLSPATKEYALRLIAEDKARAADQGRGAS